MFHLESIFHVTVLLYLVASIIYNFYVMRFIDNAPTKRKIGFVNLISFAILVLDLIIMIS